MMCDFCSSPEPRWRYPAQDFEASVTEGPGGVLVQDSIGGWAACNTCHDLIEVGDWNGLAERAADTLLEQCPGMDRDWLIGEMIQLHQRFASYRRGPGEKLAA